jgi:hypothetical protein
MLEFETIENPNKHTQIDEKNKSTTWPLNLVFSFYNLKIHPRWLSVVNVKYRYNALGGA